MQLTVLKFIYYRFYYSIISLNVLDFQRILCRLLK